MESERQSPQIRVAIVGAGPAGFYAADALLRSESPEVHVDVYDRLPTPYGLVRSGVSPDHPKIKNVTRMFEKTASHPRFRFFGNVAFGAHIDLEFLKRHYHQVLFTTGAETDRRLNIPGEDLPRSYTATEFVAWYNGHPEFVDRQFDLTHERAVVVGIGNVALDVARILLRDREELAVTDIADYALEALRKSKVREVILIGRRGPAQAAFTLPELKELDELQDIGLHVEADDVDLDPLSRENLEKRADRQSMRIVELLEDVAARQPHDKPRQITIRFLVSPVEILGDEGGVRGVRIVRNRIVERGERLAAEATDITEDIEAGLVFRSIGYRGIPLPGIPFREDWGIIPNESGRVVDEFSHPLPGLYVAGWIKRGPTGIIGTNKPDAQETVAKMLEDLANESTFHPDTIDPDVIEKELCTLQPDIFTLTDWQTIDKLECSYGEMSGRPRVKFTSIAEMNAAVRKK